jgi:hypothetical protein
MFDKLTLKKSSKYIFYTKMEANQFNGTKKSEICLIKRILGGELWEKRAK